MRGAGNRDVADDMTYFKIEKEFSTSGLPLGCAARGSVSDIRQLSG